MNTSVRIRIVVVLMDGVEEILDTAGALGTLRRQDEG